MPEEEMYIQCKLERNNQHTTAWIPTRGAAFGVSVELLPSRELWKVIDVYPSVVMSKSMLSEHQRMHRGSLPSIERMV